MMQAMPPLEDNKSWDNGASLEFTETNILLDNPWGDFDDELKELTDGGLCLDENDGLWEMEDGSQELAIINELAVSAPDLVDGQEPEAQVRPEVMEDLLEKEMKKLSFEEREQATFDLHGFCGLKVGRVPKGEVTTQEKEKLVQLDKEMKRLKLDKASNPLLRDEDFCLMFLRCEELDAKSAAQRIKNNLEIKRKVFGEDTVGRHLEVSDLTEDDLKIYESGCMRVSPQRDSAGRIVLIHVPDARPFGVTQRSVFRAHFYLMYCLARDPQVQRKGTVQVGLFTRLPNKKKSEIVKSMRLLQRIKAGLPRKISAVHFCMDTGIVNPDRNNHKLLRLWLAAVQLAMRPKVRAVFTTHVALRETIHFQLKSYGIIITNDNWPADPAVVPPPPLRQGASSASASDMDCSEASRTNASTSMSSAVEESDTSSHTLASTTRGPSTGIAMQEKEDKIVPTDYDVLLGRGKHTRNHPGNINATHIVNLHREEYESSKKFEKTAIAERIVRIIQEQGGRFLKFDDEREEWLPVDDQTARNKISHLHRNTKKSFFSFKK